MPKGLLLVPTRARCSSWIRRRGSRGWRGTRARASRATPSIQGSTAYVLSNNGYLYALRLHGSGG